MSDENDAAAALRSGDEADSMPSLTLVRSQSLPDQIADAIVEGIATGALRPGQRLIEIDLARQFSVSRVPLREALKTLEAQGIVERVPHRGVHIIDLDEASIDRVCEVRAALETIAARYAVAILRAEPTRLQRLKLVVNDMERAVRNGDWPAVNKADLAFHREVCLASKNDIVITLWEALARHVHMIFGREIISEKAKTRIVQQHRDLVDLLVTGNMEALPGTIEGHIMRLRRQFHRLDVLSAPALDG